MSESWWDELSDDELRARLEQRGLTNNEARVLVAQRDLVDVRPFIAGVLDEVEP